MTPDARTWEGSGRASWGSDASWSGVGTPTSNWAASVSNAAASDKTAVVEANSTVSSVVVSGTSGKMTVEVQNGAQLAAHTITLGPNSILAGGGHVVGNIVFDGGGVVAPGGAGRPSGELDIMGGVGPGGSFQLQLGNPQLLPILPLYRDLIPLNGDSLDITQGLDLTGTESLALTFLGAADAANLPKKGPLVLMVASEGIAGTFETITADLGVYASAADVAMVKVGPGGLGLTDEPLAVLTITLKHDLLPGDANLDGRVNALDFSILGNNFLRSGTTWRTGDFNGDGRTNALDFSILGNNFLRSVPSGDADRVTRSSPDRTLPSLGQLVPVLRGPSRPELAAGGPAAMQLVARQSPLTPRSSPATERGTVFDTPVGTPSHAAAVAPGGSAAHVAATDLVMGSLSARRLQSNTQDDLFGQTRGGVSDIDVSNIAGARLK